MIIEKELIIIGSGPAGLRAGEEAHLSGLDYLILEQGEVAQSWKDIRQDLVMLSPCLPQRDWTSISENFPIWKLDITRPFCFAWEFADYLVRFADFNNLHIATGHAVRSIKNNNSEFELETDRQKYKCKFLIIATGFFGNPFIPDIPGMRGNPIVMHSHQFKSIEGFRNKRVVIIGSGNSAAETAVILAGYAQVYMLVRNELKFFSKTKNLCDIRGISESYLLELIAMEIIRYFPNTEIEKVDHKLIYFDDHSLEVSHIICATGYNADLNAMGGFRIPLDPRTKFPVIRNLGESKAVKNLYFAGPLAYSHLTSLLIHGFIKLIPETIKAIARARIAEAV
jgi:putative flavoprotein involved in K+ transport